MLTQKQSEIVNCIKTENPKILVCSGAKRAGKTYILILAFLAQIAKFKNRDLSFILGGANQSTLRRNVLDDMEVILGRELKLDKTNKLRIFGNKVYCFDGDKANSWKRIRGFTAAGAFLNEGTALNDSFVKEAISRCSYPGARIYIDTNPENPGHSVKKDYIDKDGQRLSNGQLNIRSFSFTLFDNTTLDPEYVESIIKSTPSGMFTDRDIYGRWVTAEGIVYRDFTEQHYISRKQAEGYNYVSYFAGVDWGYEHFGAICLFGETADGTVVLLEEHAYQHMEIDNWVEIAKGIKSRYGNINFYCDSARPEHVQRFRREGVKALNANKAVISGIEQVGRRLKMKTLFIVDYVKRFKDEIVQYAWNERTGEPIKIMDDVLDAIRYAIYTHYDNSRKIKVMSREEVGIW
jgi:PBSX family phage terminase large subunit|nr:MAG TPA: large terminase [Caudoviricetes sp.]